MNKNLGLIGKKLGNTQLFDEQGMVIRVTAVQVGPCTVLGKRSVERDGYAALIIGFGEKREKLVNKPEKGFYAKNGQKPAKVVREFRVAEDVLGNYEVGQVLKPSEVFSEGQLVDVSGKSKGRGFAGVMKRHNHGGSATMSHGTHEYKRHGGSIGTSLTPGRVLPGVKMAGQYGNTKTTLLRQKLVKVLDDEGIVLIEGGVPGSRNGIVTVRGTVKPKRAQA